MIPSATLLLFFNGVGDRKRCLPTSSNDSKIQTLSYSNQETSGHPDNHGTPLILVAETSAAKKMGFKRPVSAKKLIIVSTADNNVTTAVWSYMYQQTAPKATPQPLIIDLALQIGQRKRTIQ